MPTQRAMRGLLLILAIVACGAPGGWTEEMKDAKPSAKNDTLVVKEKGGTRFLSLSDWPMTRKGGVIKAAPLEEYLSMKFGQVNDALARVTQRLDALERRMTAMDEQQGMLLNRVKMLEERFRPQEAANGHETQGGGEAAEGTTGGSP